MFLHLRIDEGVLVPTAQIPDWTAHFINDYFETATILEEGMHDVTPLSFEEGANFHWVQVLPDGTAVYGVDEGGPGEKSQSISSRCPILVISLKTRTPEAMFILAVIFYYPDLIGLQPDLSAISRN